MRGGGQRVVGFELDHRPHGDAHRGQRLLERLKLRQQRRLDAVGGLVARPEAIAKGLDDVIGRNAEVGGAVLDHLQHGVEHTDYGAAGAIRAVAEAAQTIEVTEQLVGAVNQVNDHRDSFAAGADSSTGARAS